MRNYTTDDLEILIATMDREDLLFLEAIFLKPLHEIPAHIVVVNQGKTKRLASDISTIRVINDPNYGLSRSRNLGLQHSQKDLLWILDDDCVIMPGSLQKIAEAHSLSDAAILTFQTVDPNGELVRNYEKVESSLSRKRIEKVLSPEITLKRSSILENGLSYNPRFGLGAQFQDSENHIFLMDALDKNVQIQFIPNTIVSHERSTSSDDADSNRVIYARGALAGRRNYYTAGWFQLKYALFLWRKGYVRNLKELIGKTRVFGHGVEDYLWGFESHRNHHLDL
ncbi:glycosyltransferase family 2 protein [Nonlabens marinus]|uniref:Glycosyl transferase, group 2 family protein n=1 Tax=Nonlabens marinus S1-08 TaxID=1454201 RepID=W8W010_9FLAO|nr:glycosyltransferase [Nonlabens marinus]BAO55511.1 glycosyl transferase, group 2 family protein [Nonlabens marinus S1-08]